MPFPAQGPYLFCLISPEAVLLTLKQKNARWADRKGTVFKNK
jgi:hypothetical protein